MIKEVVPLAESHATTTLLAPHQAVPAVRAGILELDYLVLVGLGDQVWPNLKFLKVDIFRRLNHVAHLIPVAILHLLLKHSNDLEVWKAALLR